jgi:Peptidase S24-like
LLPNLDVYLPRLANLHFKAIDISKNRPAILEDYSECFKSDAAGLLSLGEKGFESKYREIMVPQVQIAVNLGFQRDWKLVLSAAQITVPAGTKEESMALTAKELDVSESARQDSVSVVDDKWKEEKSPESVIVPFLESENDKSSKNYLPYYALKVAAGSFIAGDAPEPKGWVNVAKLGFKQRIHKGMFVSTVVGSSMEPTIKSGSLCVFRSSVVGSRQGLVLLVQKRHFADPETGGNYTVKRYRSSKVVDENGWRHELIELIPDNLDREQYPIMRFTPEDDDDLRVIAEFVCMFEFGDLRH